MNGAMRLLRPIEIETATIRLHNIVNLPFLARERLEYSEDELKRMGYKGSVSDPVIGLS